MRDTTLLFLIKKNKTQEVISICLAMKKRSFGVGKWNGVGGKVDQGESIVDAVIRETIEEIGVTPQNIKQVAELKFIFPNKSEWDQLTHVFMAESWVGEPIETEEMKPEWFDIKDIPYDTMWPDEKFWLPLTLSGKLVKGEFEFDEDGSMLKHNVEVVDVL